MKAMLIMEVIPTMAGIWLNKLKLLVLGLILYS